MPRADRVDGVVRSSNPLIYVGTVIEHFELTFAEGSVVRVKAERGQAVLQQLVDTDPGAARLGELALVPHSSPVAQSGLLFYNTLSGGENMGDDAFERAGGNRSAVHVDFMIGSAELDVDGVLPNGASEPLMRRGEWSVDV